MESDRELEFSRPGSDGENNESLSETHTQNPGDSSQIATPQTSTEAWLERRRKLLEKNPRYQQKVAQQRAAYERALEMQERAKKEQARILALKKREQEEEARLRDTLRREREYAKGLQAVMDAERAQKEAKQAEKTRQAIADARAQKRLEKERETAWKHQLLQQAKTVKLLRDIEKKNIRRGNSTITDTATSKSPHEDKAIADASVSQDSHADPYDLYTSGYDYDHEGLNHSNAEDGSDEGHTDEDQTSQRKTRFLFNMFL